MRFHVWLLCWWVLAIPGHAMATTSQSSSLRCLTFNMLHGGVFSGRVGNAQNLDRRLDIIFEELDALEVDIIGLQEASTGNDRGNVAERLAARLGFHFVYAPASFRLFASERLNTVASWVMNLTEGPAIMSRFPIVSWQVHDLPRCGRFTDPRILLCAELQTPWGALSVCSTHTSGLPCQTESIVRVLENHGGPLPLLLMGDFNAPEDSPAMTALTQGAGFIDTFRVVNPAVAGRTVWQQVNAAQPTVFRRVDYVLLAPGREIPGRVLASRVVLNTPQQLPDGQVLWPSDHYGVLTEVQLESRPE